VSNMFAAFRATDMLAGVIAGVVFSVAHLIGKV
jgi:hypothetical protein